MPQALLHRIDYPLAATVNAGLAEAILALPSSAFNRRSHFFHGRYENLYIDAGRLPGLEAILTTARVHAAAILGQAPASLRLGFWLNIMHRGDVTTLHSHDDDDEVLSGVYYVQVPAEAGLFRLYQGKEVEEIRPVEGRFMFFDPALPHEVSEHRGEAPRISIGMNFGLPQLD